MESIVLHSDIARLVLGYLVNNNLKRAALTLCRTSPHLHQEFVAFRQGLQPHNFLNGGLEEMIREHVKITGMVANAVHKLPLERRLRLQQLKLSERLGDLLKLDKSTSTSARDSACPRNANTNTQRKRRRMRGHAMLSDEELPGSCKRPRLLAPHLYCSIERSCRNLSDDNDSLESSTGSDMSSAQTDDGLSFHGRGPKNNSTPRTATSNDAELVMPMPQAMPALTQAIMTNEDFQQKLLNNINVALQSVTVHAPTVESVNSEAVLDDLVKNILEATEKDPSFDRVLQEVVGIETPQVAGNPTAPGALIGTAGTAMTSEAAPPQTPLIIRNAVASANGSAVNGDVNVVNGSGNAVIQLNANSSIGTLIDPNFSISKLIVLNSNESAQKQQQAPAVNLSFTTENLINFADGGAALTDADAVGNQVCVDATNGQLTFPMFLSNDGLFSHLPFLVNNEWLAQQLRSDVFANGDVSHIEIPLPEPITVAANQLPPNSIIINSAVKHPPPPASVEPPVQLIEEPPKPLTTDAPQLERSASKLPSGNAVPASLDSSRLVQERVTPSTSGIVNVKAFRSLSTPRKRTSHVRTLNFSPKAVTQLHNTPVSTRRAQLQHQRQQRRIKQKALKEQQTEEHDKPVEVQPEKPIIIKNVEILPKFGSSPNQAVVEVEEVAESAAAGTGTVGGGGGGVSGGSADMSANESNSCVPPLFAMEEGSNQTVIKAATASKTTASIVAATPKRKQKRRAAVKACKRIISQAVVVEEPILDAQQPQQEQEQQEELDASVSTSLDDSKENQIVAVQVPEEQDDMMAAWQRQLHGKSSTDLEHRLREINAKRQETLKGQPRVRRKKKALNTPLSNKLKKLKTPPSGKKKKQKELQEKQAKQEKTGQSANVEGEFNIKIPTPQKQKRSTQTKESKLMKEGKQMKELEEPQQPQEQQQQPQPQPQEEKQPQPQPEPLEQEVVQEQVEDLPAPVQLEQLKESIDVPSLSALLETPYKVMIMDAGEVPPTPGPTLIPPLATPYAKLLPSASFLFGSDTKSLLDTPMLTAITPGMRLGTPFGHSLGTPHSSAAKTDYSSGSSYYRPDEAEHTDTNAQCALQPAMSPHNDVEQTTKLSSACLELYAERLPVEPTVLRRVRSFGTEAVDSAEGAAAILPNVEPAMVELAHYKLVSGLPDAVVDNSSSSSCASSSTFSSSSSSSSSGSASSSNSNSSNSSAGSSSAPSSQMANTVLPAKTIQLLDMQNLSDISSTEDEEWLKAAAAAAPQHASPLAIDSEPAQLVSQDGEVRYPLRNWLTPSKDAAAAADTSGEMAPPAALPMPPAAAIAALPAPPPPPPTLSAPVTPPPPPAPQTPPPPPPADPPSSSTESPAPAAPTAPAATVADEKLNQELAMEQLRQDLAKVRERVKAKVKQQPTPKARRRNTNKKLTAMRETAKLANPTSSAAKSPKKQAKAGQKVSAEMAKKAAAGAVGAAGATAEAVEAGAAVEGGSIEAEAIAGAEREAEGTEVTETVDAGPGAADVATADGAAEQLSTAGASPLGAALSHETPSEMMPSSSDLDPALLMALNLSAKKQQMQPKTGRVAVEIAAQPAPTTLSTGARRGRPKKPLITEPARLSMRRSSRLIDNKTPAPEDSQAEATTRLAKSSSNAKVTKKPAKKRAEARLETAAPTLATLAEAQTTQQSPEQQPASSVSNGDYELDMYRSISHVENTYSFAYADDGSKPTQPVSRQPPSYFKNFQMRIMVDSGEMHSIRITCPQLLHHSPSADEDYAGSAASIKNIPKKRKPVAASTPLANDVNADEEEERDDDDLEVATINTPMKMNSSDDLAMEPHDAGVQIEDIESILSHLHGT